MILETEAVGKYTTAWCQFTKIDPQGFSGALLHIFFSKVLSSRGGLIK